jgi:hypothetical protein
MRPLCWCVGLLAFLLFVPPAAQPADQDTPAEKVRKAIGEGIRYLKQKQKPDGNWEDSSPLDVSHPGGFASLALLALLHSSVPVDDPVIKRSLEYLRTIDPSRTYVVSLQTMVFAKAGQATDRARIQRNVDWLLKNHGPSGWTYGEGGPAKADLSDNSNTAYALIALHEGLLAGATVKPEVFKELRDHYLKTQVNGGWSYRNKRSEQPTMSMTAAGVCGLAITSLALDKPKLRADGSAVDCGAYPDTKAINDGLNWIGNRFPARFNDDRLMSMGYPAPFYCLYDLERLGHLTGQRYLGGHDWYRLGSEYLVKIQKEDGSWALPNPRPGLDSPPVVSTGYALLFLVGGRTPVLITKFAHGDGDGWNNKHSDLRHLVAFANRELFKKQPRTWQVFDVRQIKAEDKEDRKQLAADLQPSPLVYVNGHRLQLDDKEKAILKEYLDNGGFLVAEACCNDKLFDRDFKKLMAELFPKSELQPVLKGHPVWAAAGKGAVKPDEFPLLGIQKGGRWVVMYSPKALTGYWEANEHERGRGKTAFLLGANIIAYATGQGGAGKPGGK